MSTCRSVLSLFVYFLNIMLFCGMAKCYVMNPLIGMIHQIRVLLDSGGNLSLINNDVTRKIGLPGDTVNINLNVASLQI